MKHPGIAGLVARMVRAQVQTELQYRANVVMQAFQAVLAAGVALVILSLVLAQVDELNGWTQPQLVILVGQFTVVGALLRTIARPNLGMLLADIRKGTLDYVLLKPVDTQLLVSVRRLELWQVIDVLVGVALICWGVSELEHGPRLGDVAVFACSVLLGLVIIYCFLFSLVSTAFWFVRMDDVIELFESVYQAGRWPVSIYPDWMRSGLTFVVPISFAVTVPVETLLGQASVAVLVGQVVMAGCCLAFTRWFFTVALRRYTGASS